MAHALSNEFLDTHANYRVWIHSATGMWHDNNIQKKPNVSIWWTLKLIFREETIITSKQGVLSYFVITALLCNICPTL